MAQSRFNQLMASAAVAMALALTASPKSAFSEVLAAVNDAVPLPDTSQVTPPTNADVTPATAAPASPAATQPESAAGKTEPAATKIQAAKPHAPDTTGTVETPVDSTAAADAAVTDKLRELANGKFDRILGKKERVSVEAFYSGRNFAPLWVSNGGLNERGKAAAAFLGGVDADGLDPADYPVPAFKQGVEPDALADAEIRLTQSILTFARHAQDGRVHFSRVSADIDYDLTKVDPAEVLKTIANATNVAQALDSFNPQQPGYKALKAKLAEIRGKADEAAPSRIEAGKLLKYAVDKKGKETLMDDERVPVLRERLGVSGEGTTYDKMLADAVSKFQKEHSLVVNGQLTAATIEAINGPRRDKDHTVNTILVNLERWRWMPRELGATHVMVNIPDYRLRLIREGKLYWTTKVVVGQPGKPTPLMSAEMKFITVNPTWNVPPSIIKNEYLPALAQDPQALDRIGLKMETNKDGTIRIYQPPGDRNALGRIRFNFPNKFLVYQHDTPDKNLFARDKRAFSHGCMRVQDPLKYAEMLLSIELPQEHYTEERIHKMFGGSEVNINFPKFLPVHLTYQTAFVDDDGKLQIREDVYGRDAALLNQLKGSERRVADTAIDRPKSTQTAPVRAPAGLVTGNGSREPNFFDRLFGSRAEATTPPPAEKQKKTRSARSASAQQVR